MEISVIENSIFILTGFVGFTTMILLLFSIRSNKHVNFFFLLITGIISFRALVRGTYGFHLQSIAADFSTANRSLMLIIFPLFYLYFKGLIADQKKIIWKDLVHLIFPIVFSFFFKTNANFHLIDNENVRVYYLAVTIIFPTIYLVLIWQLVYKIFFNEVNSSNVQHYNLIRNWSIFLLIVSTFQVVRLIISLLIDFSQNTLLTGNPYSIVSSIIWIIIFGKILITPEILFGLPKLNQRIKNFQVDKMVLTNFWNSQISTIENPNDFKMRDKMDQKALIIIQEIEQVFVTKLLFKNPKISISELAVEIGEPVSHIVYLFKYHCTVNFTEFKTIHRINHAKELIKEGFLSINTMETLAFEVGFSSYNPFFTAFKKYTNQSPNDYFRSLNKVQNKN
jgi:AraC-like DNA-binding protein